MKKILILIVVLGMIALLYFVMTENRRLVAGILKTKVPSSVSNIECESWGFTDVLTTCVFDVKPIDFPSLLDGWEFKEQRNVGKSHDLGGGPKLGQNFSVSTSFIVHPAEFPHGGHVSVLANKSRSKVSIDIYIE